MEIVYPFLEKISELGEPYQPKTVELAIMMEKAARGLDIPALDSVVERLDKYYRFEIMALSLGKAANCPVSVDLDNTRQAKQMLICAAIFNLGVAVRPGFKVKLATPIKPGGLFGIDNVMEDRNAILKRKLTSDGHLALTLSIIDAFRNIS